MTDPRIIGLTPEGRMAQRQARVQRRVAVLERSSLGGGGATGPLGGDVIGSIGANTINTTASPQVARLGVGTVAVTGAALASE